MAKLTPMMEQYFQIKNKYKDCITVWEISMKCFMRMRLPRQES